MRRMPMSIAGWRVTARKKLFVIGYLLFEKKEDQDDSNNE